MAYRPLCFLFTSERTSRAFLAFGHQEVDGALTAEVARNKPVRSLMGWRLYAVFSGKTRLQVTWPSGHP